MFENNNIDLFEQDSTIELIGYAKNHIIEVSDR